MNEYDSSRMMDALIATHNMIPTNEPSEASLILLFICSIRE